MNDEPILSTSPQRLVSVLVDDGESFLGSSHDGWRSDGVDDVLVVDPQLVKEDKRGGEKQHSCSGETESSLSKGLEQRENR